MRWHLRWILKENLKSEQKSSWRVVSQLRLQPMKAAEMKAWGLPGSEQDQCGDLRGSWEVTEPGLQLKPLETPPASLPTPRDFHLDFFGGAHPAWHNWESGIEMGGAMLEVGGDRSLKVKQGQGELRELAFLPEIGKWIKTGALHIVIPPWILNGLMIGYIHWFYQRKFIHVCSNFIV